MDMAAENMFNPKRYDFVETSHIVEPHENYEDMIEDKIFKYKYRQNADDPANFTRRQRRVIDRFWDRAQVRDSAVEKDLYELYQRDGIDASTAQFALDWRKYETTALNETAPLREYMVKESIQQYRDYYESDEEEQGFFEYLGNVSNRDRIRLMEIGEDYSVIKTDQSGYSMIAKREFNPELSAVSNLVLDMVDFRDRIKPLSRDMALLDISRQHQRHSYADHKRAR
jgi:hypothetical protein